MLQLGHGDDDGQAVDEAEHHRIGHQPHELAKAQDAEQDHQQAAQQYRRQQILNALLHHQRHDDHGHRPRSPGDHSRSPAEQRRQRADDERPIQAHQRIEVRHQRKGDALGHQREGCGEPCQDFGA